MYFFKFELIILREGAASKANKSQRSFYYADNHTNNNYNYGKTSKTNSQNNNVHFPSALSSSNSLIDENTSPSITVTASPTLNRPKGMRFYLY